MKFSKSPSWTPVWSSVFHDPAAVEVPVVILQCCQWDACQHISALQNMLLRRQHVHANEKRGCEEEIEQINIPKFHHLNFLLFLKKSVWYFMVMNIVNTIHIHTFIYIYIYFFVIFLIFHMRNCICFTIPEVSSWGCLCQASTMNVFLVKVA